MEIFNARTYTYNDTVQGSVSIGSREDVKEILIELRGVIFWSTEPRGRIKHRETIYTRRKKIPILGPIQTEANLKTGSIDFEIGFPEFDHHTSIPATVAVIQDSLKVECRHTITATIARKICFSPRTRLEQELKFIPSESIERLSTPTLVHRQDRFGGLIVSTKLKTPAVFAQNGINNSVLVRLLRPKAAGLQITACECLIKWRGISSKGNQKRPLEIAVTVSSSASELDDSNTYIVTTFRLPECNWPIYQSPHMDCGYYLVVRVRLWNSKVERHQEITFHEPVTVLPTLLHKDKPGHFATKGEIRALLDAKAKLEANSSHMQALEQSVDEDCTSKDMLPRYSL